jgi:hypothetical protein
VVGLRLPEDFPGTPRPAEDEVVRLPVEECGATLGPLLDAQVRTRFAIGPLERRCTRPRPEGYIANTCIHCRATQGSFPLEEELTAFVNAHPAGERLLWRDEIAVDFPIAVLTRALEDYNESASPLPWHPEFECCENHEDDAGVHIHRFHP